MKSALKYVTVNKGFSLEQVWGVDVSVAAQALVTVHVLRAFCHSAAAGGEKGSFKLYTQGFLPYYSSPDVCSNSLKEQKGCSALSA